MNLSSTFPASNTIFMCPLFAITDDFIGTRLLFIVRKLFPFTMIEERQEPWDTAHHILIHKVREEATWWQRHPNWQCFLSQKCKAIKYLMKKGATYFHPPGNCFYFLIYFLRTECHFSKSMHTRHVPLPGYRWPVHGH